MPKKIRLNTKSSAQLNKEMREILSKDIPDPTGGIASILPQKPHTILGVPAENYHSKDRQRP